MARVKAKPAKKSARPPELEHFYYWVSGLTAEACCFVGIRCEAGGDGPPDGGESWLLAARGGKVELVHGTERPLIAAYRAPTGEIFTVDDVGNTARFDGQRRTERSLPAKMMGIWGLDAKLVFAWGFARGELIDADEVLAELQRP